MQDSGLQTVFGRCLDQITAYYYKLTQAGGLIMIGIYRITNTVNNKIYIGQSTNIKRRWRSHKCNAKNEKYYNNV